MNTEYRTRALADSGFNLPRIDVERGKINVHEYGYSSAIANCIRGSDKRMTDGNHFIARLHSNREQRQMKRSGATGNGTSMRGADKVAELPFERRNLGTLRHPSGKNGAPRRLHFFFTKQRSRNRNKILRHG